MAHVFALIVALQALVLLRGHYTPRSYWLGSAICNRLRFRTQHEDDQRSPALVFHTDVNDVRIKPLLQAPVDNKRSEHIVNFRSGSTPSVTQTAPTSTLVSKRNALQRLFGNGNAASPAARSGELKGYRIASASAGANTFHPAMVRGFAYFRRATELLGRSVDVNMDKVQLAGKVFVAATVGKLCGSGCRYYVVVTLVCRTRSDCCKTSGALALRDDRNGAFARFS
jgi:hypothetical protein